MSRGFDYKKRRDWQARGAKREWPPLNVQETDPSLVVNNAISTGIGAGQLTWISITADTQTIPNNTNTTIASANWTVDDASGTADALSNDYPASAWLNAGTDSFRLPRAGNFAIVARAVWDANTTGVRSLAVATGVLAGEDNILVQEAADVSAGSNSDQSVPNVGYTQGGEIVHIDAFQDSGASRTCTFHVFVAYVSSTGGVVGGGGGGGGTSPLQETYVSAITSGAQTITTGTLTTIASTAFGVGNLLSSDHVIGDWLDGTTNSVRFPKAGIATIQITVDWDTNTTGNRFTQYQSAGVSNVATNISNAATDFVADHLQVVTNQDLYSAGDYGLIQVKQDSGANRTCTCEFVVFYHPTV